MRLALAAALFLSASVALAAEPDYVFAHPGGQILRLHDTPCVSEEGALASLPPSVRVQFKAATVTIEDQSFAACWAETERGPFIIDQFGGRGSLGGSPFKPAVDA